MPFWSLRQTAHQSSELWDLVRAMAIDEPSLITLRRALLFFFVHHLLLSHPMGVVVFAWAAHPRLSARSPRTVVDAAPMSYQCPDPRPGASTTASPPPPSQISILISLFIRSISRSESPWFYGRLLTPWSSPLAPSSSRFSPVRLARLSLCSFAWPSSTAQYHVSI